LSSLAEGLVYVFFRVLIYPGLTSMAIAGATLAAVVLRPVKPEGPGAKADTWRILVVWTVLCLGSYALPVPGSGPPFVAGDGLFTLALVHVAVAHNLLPQGSRIHVVAAWTLGLGVASLATLSNFLWQDWARLTIGEWYQRLVAGLGALCIALWGVIVLGEAVSSLSEAAGAGGSLARMGLAALGWFSASAAVAVGLPAVGVAVYLGISLAVAAVELAVARAVATHRKAKVALMALGPAAGISSLAVAVFALKFLVPSA
jgi:hypothetical protein